MREEQFILKKDKLILKTSENNSQIIISIVIEIVIIAASVTVLIKGYKQTSKVHLSFKQLSKELNQLIIINRKIIKQ